MKKIRKKEEDGELTQGQIRQIEKARARPAPPRPAPPRPARPAVAVQGDGQARDWAEPPPFGGQDEERVKELEASMLPQEEALALLLRQIGDSQLPKGQLRTGGRKAGAAGGDSDDEGGRSDDDEFYDRASVPPPPYCCPYPCPYCTLVPPAHQPSPAPPSLAWPQGAGRGRR